ncbi:MAG: cell division protein ZapA [Muricoprocola sp.]
MSAKNQTQVVINGKIYKISGYESEEYIQKVGYYLDSKLTEMQKLDSYRRQSNDTKNILVQLNIADDYFKAKKQADVLEEGISARDKEIFELKHNLIDLQRKYDELKKNSKQ